MLVKGVTNRIVLAPKALPSAVREEIEAAFKRNAMVAPAMIGETKAFFSTTFYERG